jgi:hypothetical protein
MALVINETLIESLLSVDEAVGHFHHYLLLPDLIDFEDLASVTGDVWEAWAFNGATFEPSVYSGFAFNSYTVEGGVTYAAREEGIYILDGTTDSGSVIHDGVILSPTMFNLQNRKRFRQAFFDIAGSAPVIRGEVSGQAANIPILHGKAMFPRALVGNKWTFLIADFDSLGQIELFPVVLTR